MVHVGNLSLVPTRLKQAPTPRRSLGDRRQTDSAIVLGHLTPPPSWQPWSMGKRFWTSSYTTTLAYWAHIPACNQYIQCLLTGPTHQSLTDIGGGLQPWRCWFFISHSPPFPTSGLHFSPKGPIQSQVIHSIITRRSKKGTNHKYREWEPPLDFYHKHSVC
jgi:hypothetical protein